LWVSKADPVVDGLNRDVPRNLIKSPDAGARRPRLLGGNWPHEVRELLARVYSCFTEGLDTPGLKETVAPLEELA
jgi:hypothetical protein